MDIRLLVETPVVGLASLLSFGSPAVATYWGIELAGAMGGVVGWLLSHVFVLAVIFPGLGSLIAKIEGDETALSQASTEATPQ